MLLIPPASVVAVAFVVGLIGIACWRTSAARSAPYVPTPHSTVRKMLDIAGVGPDDVVYDLGSGDGRLVIAAVRDYGARRAVGIEVDFRRIRDSRRNAAAAGVGDRAAFVEGDFFKQDFRGASVVTVFMLPHVLEKLRPLLLDCLAPGTRLVSQQFDLGEWAPDLTARDGRRDVFLWHVPARVGGDWRWRAGEGTSEGRLTLSRRFQHVAGVLTLDGATLDVEDGRLTGTQIAFTARDRAGHARHFSGTVTEDGLIRGDMDGARVEAVRASPMT